MIQVRYVCRLLPDDALCPGADGFNVLISFEDSKRGVTDLDCVELSGHHNYCSRLIIIRSVDTQSWLND